MSILISAFHNLYDQRKLKTFIKRSSSGVKEKGSQLFTR